jgi:hypothetical protein
MNSNPNKADRASAIDDLHDTVLTAVDGLTTRLGTHIRVLEDAIMAMRSHTDFSVRLRAQILMRVDTWLLELDPGVTAPPLLFSQQVYDWLYPPPATVTQEGSRRTYYVTVPLEELGYHHENFEVTAVSLDQAYHLATVELTKDLKLERYNQDFPKVYGEVRRTLEQSSGSVVLLASTAGQIARVGAAFVDAAQGINEALQKAPTVPARDSAVWRPTGV